MSDKREPMDATTRERLVGQPKTNRERNAYALDVLIEEVLALFPETTYEVSGRDGRNTALHVQFYAEDEDLWTLLGLLDNDPRIEEVLFEESDRLVLVALRPNLRTQDSRDPFGLDDAYLTLTEEDGL